MAVAALVLGVIGVVWILVPIPGTFWIGVILGILAIIFGVIARKGEKGKGMGTGGMILGIIAVVLNLLIFMVCAAALEEAAPELRQELENLQQELDQIQ